MRADDSRFGEEGNLLRTSAVAPGPPDSRPPTFAGLESAETLVECGAIALSWNPAAEACGPPVAYDIYRDTSPLLEPSPSNLAATTWSSSGFVDVGLEANASYTYVVRARDVHGNQTADTTRRTAIAGATDRSYVRFRFESGPENWFLSTPNDADAGYWEWGDPTGTPVQPEDCAEGHGCWITGSDRDDDVDGGSTTLVSDERYLYGFMVDPAIEYSRWFTNDRGTNAGLDPLLIDMTDDDGASWKRVDEVGSGTPLQWEKIQVPLPDERIIATDGGGDSLVEAGIDDFKVIDRLQGCDANCYPAAIAVQNVLVRRAGDDVVLDWSQDVWVGTRYSVYALSGPGFTEALRIGTTDSKVFVHEGAALHPGDFFYRVSSFDPCGDESRLD